MEPGGQGSFQASNCKGPPGLPCAVTPQGRWPPRFPSMQSSMLTILSMECLSGWEQWLAIGGLHPPGVFVRADSKGVTGAISVRADSKGLSGSGQRPYGADPHTPGYSVKRGWIVLITRGLIFLASNKRLQLHEMPKLMLRGLAERSKSFGIHAGFGEGGYQAGTC